MGDFLGMGSKDASTNASTNTSTQNVDRRQVVDSGGFGIASDGATVNIQTTSVDSALAQKALDVVSGADATAGQGFSQLLTLADKLFTGAGQAVNAAQETSLKQVEALNTVANDAKGAIDQKTIIIMAAAGLGAAILMRKKA